MFVTLFTSTSLTQRPADRPRCVIVARRGRDRLNGRQHRCRRHRESKRSTAASKAQARKYPPSEGARASGRSLLRGERLAPAAGGPAPDVTGVLTLLRAVGVPRRTPRSTPGATRTCRSHPSCSQHESVLGQRHRRRHHPGGVSNEGNRNSNRRGRCRLIRETSDQGHPGARGSRRRQARRRRLGLLNPDSASAASTDDEDESGDPQHPVLGDPTPQPRSPPASPAPRPAPAPAAP